MGSVIMWIDILGGAAILVSWILAWFLTGMAAREIATQNKRPPKGGDR